MLGKRSWRKRLLWVLLGLIGIFVGLFGTLVGAGGGFLIVPVLLFLYPQEPPTIITSISLAVTFFNALSGSIAYGHLKRIDYRSALMFSLVGIPGAILGAYITSFLSRGAFQITFGIILLIVSGYLMVRPTVRVNLEGLSATGNTIRKITDITNHVFTYSFNLPLGMAIAFLVGVLSGLLGIGGGIIHVPVLTQVLGFPIHVATATSQFVIATTTFSALDVHIVTGTFAYGVRRAIVLSVGAVIGAQLGARLSQRVSGVFIIRALALGLGVVALRLIIAPF
ncbi:MAG: sulfite exporter TauE/SafE family protein [Chloroflexi bacterium]|nr:sulfite exporter TauE/SafE family protein [Chloroflexota bacterium]